MFKKARQLVKQNRVFLDVAGPSKMFFYVYTGKNISDETGQDVPHSVILEYKEGEHGHKFLAHSCTCRHMSQTHPSNLCSHKLAAIYWLTERAQNKVVQPNNPTRVIPDVMKNGDTDSEGEDSAII